MYNPYICRVLHPTDIARIFHAYMLRALRYQAGLLLCLLCLSWAPHPYYLSVTEIKYNARSSACELSVKLFTNDIEDALKKSSGRQVDLLHPANKAETGQQLLGYIQKRLSLEINDKALACNLIGYEKEEEAIWVYLETGKTAKPRTVKIENKLLFDYLPQQINIVHVEVDGKRQSAKATNPDAEFSFNF